MLKVYFHLHEYLSSDRACTYMLSNLTSFSVGLTINIQLSALSSIRIGVWHFRPLPCAENCISAWMPIYCRQLLELILENIEELVRNMNVGCSLGCSDHHREELRMLREGKEVKGRMPTQDG